MADDRWTVAAPGVSRRRSGRKILILGLPVVIAGLVGVALFLRPQPEPTPNQLSAVRESAAPNPEPKPDHPTAKAAGEAVPPTAQAPREPAPDPATEDPNAPGHWDKAVNLLASIDPAKDAVQGNWTRQDDAWTSDGSELARIGIPHKPPQEYDLRVTFTRTGGNECAFLVLGTPERSFAWLMGGWDNTLFGFEMIGGQRADANRSTVKCNPALQNDHTYTTIIRVRRDRLQAYFDGRLLADLPMNYAEMSLPDYWQVREQHGFALGSHRSATRFHRAELLDVTRPAQPPRPIPTPAPVREPEDPSVTEF